MANYIEYIKAAGGETYQIKDSEAARRSETETALGEKVNTSELFDLIYPVGAIYLSATDVDPGTIFGGTWEQIKDRFLLSAGDSYAAGSTGGEATHTLTVNEIAAHNHEVSAVLIGSAGDTIYGTYPNSSSHKGLDWVVNPKTSSTGGGQAHNNMPPYLTVYMWKRVE